MRNSKNIGEQQFQSNRGLFIRSSNKKILIVGILTLFLLGMQITRANATYLDRDDELKPEMYHYERIQYSEHENPWEVEFKGNGTIEYYLLNATELGIFLTDLNSNHAIIQQNVSYSESLKTKKNTWDYDLLYNEYGFQNKTNENGENYLDFYLFIYNPSETNTIDYLLLIDYSSETIELFAKATIIALIGLCLILALYLLIHSNQERKEGEKIKAGMLRGYSLALVLGASVYLVWEIDTWYFIENNQRLLRINKFTSNILGGMGINALVLWTLIGFGMLLMMVVFQIERTRKKKIRQLYFTGSICFGLILIIIGYLISSIFDIFLILYALLTLIPLAWLTYTFVKVIQFTTGEVRKKTILIIVGLVGLLLMGVSRNFLIPSNLTLSFFISNILSILFLISFYYGVI